MEIVKLNPKKYAGQKFTARYITNGYYDIVRTTGGFDIEYKRFDSPVERSFDDTFFGEWLDNPVAYGAFENGKLLGFVEGAPEGWNNRYRRSKLCGVAHPRPTGWISAARRARGGLVVRLAMCRSHPGIRCPTTFTWLTEPRVRERLYRLCLACCYRAGCCRNFGRRRGGCFRACSCLRPFPGCQCRVG